MSGGQTAEELGRAWGHTAVDGFHESAAFFRALPDDAWDGPTGCADWDERYLSGHILGEVVWYPNMLRSTFGGAPEHPKSLYEEMMGWAPERQNARMDEAAEELRAEVDRWMPDHAGDLVDIGWSKVPLWQATYVILMEGVYHNWDTRAGTDPHTTIPTAWAVELTKGVTFSAPLIAHQDAVARASGRYHLQVGDGADDVTVAVDRGELAVDIGLHGTPDVVLRLTADQSVRLVAGRLKLVAAVESGEVHAEGDRALIAELQHIFGGIANG